MPAPASLSLAFLVGKAEMPNDEERVELEPPIVAGRPRAEGSSSHMGRTVRAILRRHQHAVGANRKGHSKSVTAGQHWVAIMAAVVPVVGMIADGAGRASALRLAPGWAHELTRAVPLWARLPSVPKGVVADRGCTSRAFRQDVWNMGARPAIPSLGSGAPVACRNWICHKRSRVERLWAQLSEWFARATRDAKPSASVFRPAARLDRIGREQALSQDWPDEPKLSEDNRQDGCRNDCQRDDHELGRKGRAVHQALNLEHQCEMAGEHSQTVLSEVGDGVRHSQIGELERHQEDAGPHRHRSHQNVEVDSPRHGGEPVDLRDRQHEPAEIEQRTR